MAIPSLDSELNKYWSLLTPTQKKFLLLVIESFVQSPEIKNQDLQEPKPVYGKDDEGLSLEILQQLSWEQKEALISLIESFGIEVAEQRISIKKYNKELKEMPNLTKANL